ncbi:ArsR/SmtB family transcription factor [Amycolatopsis sacchari]|uniref:ArsR/SmtB family transcription factor n=1 Tax=Amycolatopsis sacchari TaxID=115433 RepID=UPI003EBAADFB
MGMNPVTTERDCDDIAPAVALFSSLGDPARLRILRRLARGDARVMDLTAELGLAQPTVSKHLACLRDCALVDSRPDGRASWYSLTCPELLDLLVSAERLLSLTGNAVALCPTYGQQAIVATVEASARPTAD